MEIWELNPTWRCDFDCGANTAYNLESLGDTMKTFKRKILKLGWTSLPLWGSRRLHRFQLLSKFLR